MQIKPGLERAPINIDFVLNELVNNPRAKGHVSDGELLLILEKKDIDPDGLVPILIKLERDKYADTHVNSQGIKRYAASIEGIEFIRSGGYAALHRNEKLKRELEELSNKKLKIDLVNAERIYKSYQTTRIFAWIGAISGLVALILTLLRLMHKLPE